MKAALLKKKFNPLKNAGRLKTIVATFAKHGFQGVVERAKLGRFIFERLSSPEIENLAAPERLRMCFEQLGPSFVKLGQLLATRPDLIPTEFVDEFKKLHDQVPALPFEKIETVLINHFGQDLNLVFRSFDENPLAAASIAQVHKAVLLTGESVVVKVQRPGIDAVIEEDVSILYNLAEIIDRYIPESKAFNPRGIVDEFAKSLEFETNFVIEANNIRRFAQNFSKDPGIKIPTIYQQYTGRRVLVMEQLHGIPLSHKNALDQEGIDPEMVLRRGLKAYLKMVFTDGLFHGDLHAGNLFVLPNSKIGLIDFGVVGRLNRSSQTAIANMLIALAEEDYDRLAYTYIDLAPYSEHADVDRFARELRDLIAPYVGLTLKNVNAGRMLLDSTAVAARHGLILPSELVLFFKSIMTIEGMGRMIMRDFDFLAYSVEFAAELVQSRYEPKKIAKDLSFVARDMNALLNTLPRQIKQLLRRINNPDYAWRIHWVESDLIRRTFEKGFNLIFLGLVIGSLIASASYIFVNSQGLQESFWLAVTGYGLSAILSIAAFINYIRK